MTLYINKECDCQPTWPACVHLPRTFMQPATDEEILEAAANIVQSYALSKSQAKREIIQRNMDNVPEQPQCPRCGRGPR